ncbi:YslB family protein [Calidifontibacillus oryziterrae]|uniref:YslB family protein n=1 Tax=Calidifontibacillus oryziterrae TaxID=1191699 RepID=UPI00031C8853|nr:YslB family protein [Calidifontibacillus oryziterrae]
MFTKKQKEDYNETLSHLTIPAFGYELIREALLKDLLGKDYSSILYWSGKNLARQMPLQSLDEIISFYKKSGWGNLEIIKERKGEMIFSLKSDWIHNRLQREGEISFHIEAGFLAEQIRNAFGHEAEAMEEQKKKTSEVIITVKWD